MPKDKAKKVPINWDKPKSYPNTVVARREEMAKIRKAFNVDKDRASLDAQLRNDIERPNNVNHPAHYGGDTVYETIKVIEAWELNFNLGNAVKYLSRAGKKHNTLEDLKKARWYLEREIAKLENQK